MNDDNCQDCLQQETKLCPITGEQYTEQLRYLLPRGHAWNPCDWLGSRLYQYWRSFGELLATAHNRMCDYLNEAFPCTATEALSDWERVVGIPDECFPEITDLNARQQRVCALLGAQNGNDCAFMMALAASIGWEVECQDLSKLPIADAGCLMAGCDQLPPFPINPEIGNNLGFLYSGFCGEIGSNLGCVTSDCCIYAGYHNVPDLEESNQIISPCINPPISNENKIIRGISELRAGFQNIGIPTPYRPYAHHLEICIKSDNQIGSFAFCESFFQAGCNQASDPLQKYNPGNFISTDTLIAGCGTAGCSAVCSPNWKNVFCLIERYKPAHVVMLYRFC